MATTPPPIHYYLFTITYSLFTITYNLNYTK